MSDEFKAVQDGINAVQAKLGGELKNRYRKI